MLRTGNDRLGYQVLVDGNNLTHRFLNGRATYEASSIGQLELGLDVNGSFNTASVQLDDTIVVNGSLDAGASWYCIFSGSINSYNTTMGADGKRQMSIAGNNNVGLRSLILTPNQASMGPCDVYQAFEGTPSDSNGLAWVTDSKGNYPNGFLYRTGYGYSTDSVHDLFVATGSESVAYDLPQEVLLNGQNISEGIGTVADTLGLVYFFDDPTAEMRCYQDSSITDFPALAVTLSDGNDIATAQYGMDGSSVADRVTIIGASPDIYATYVINAGSREILITDSELTTVEACRAKAVQYASMYEGGNFRSSVRCAPVNTSILGKRISLLSRAARTNGDPLTTNVIGVTHDFANDHWYTDVSLESKRPTIARTLVEVQDSLNAGTQEVVSPCAYLHLVGDGVRSAAAGFDNICAIGVGSSSNANTSIMRAIVPVSGMPFVPKQGGPTVATAAIGTQFAGRIREMGVYVNDLKDGKCFEGTMSCTVPLNTYDASMTAAVLGVVPKTYPMQVTEVKVNNYGGDAGQNYWYWLKAKDVELMRTKVVEGASTIAPSPGAHLDWKNPTYCDYVPEAKANAMGALLPSEPYLFKGPITDGPSTDVAAANLIYFDWTLEVPGNAWAAVQKLVINVEAAEDASSVQAWGTLKWKLFDFTSATWVELGTSTNEWTYGEPYASNPSQYVIEMPKYTGAGRSFINDEGHVCLVGILEATAKPSLAQLGLYVFHAGLAYEVDRASCIKVESIDDTMVAYWDTTKAAATVPSPGSMGVLKSIQVMKELTCTVNGTTNTMEFNYVVPVTYVRGTPTVPYPYRCALRVAGGFAQEVDTLEPISNDLAITVTQWGRDAAGTDYGVINAPGATLSCRQGVLGGYQWVVPLKQTIVGIGGFYIEYSALSGKDPNMPTIPVPDLSMFPINYADDGLRSGSIGMRPSEGCIEPGVPLFISYKAVGGELARRFIVSPDSRIDQGVAKKAATTIYVSAEMDLGATSSEVGIIGGPGVALPGAR